MKILIEIETGRIEQVLQLVEYLEQKAKVKAVKFGEFTQTNEDVEKAI